MKSEFQIELEAYAIGRTIHLPHPSVFLVAGVNSANGEVFFTIASMCSPADVVLSCFENIAVAQERKDHWRDTITNFKCTPDEWRQMMKVGIASRMIMLGKSKLYQQMNP